MASHIKPFLSIFFLLALVAPSFISPSVQATPAWHENDDVFIGGSSLNKAAFSDSDNYTAVISYNEPNVRVCVGIVTSSYSIIWYDNIVVGTGIGVDDVGISIYAGVIYFAYNCAASNGYYFLGNIFFGVVEISNGTDLTMVEKQDYHADTSYYIWGSAVIEIVGQNLFWSSLDEAAYFLFSSFISAATDVMQRHIRTSSQAYYNFDITLTGNYVVLTVCGTFYYLEYSPATRTYVTVQTGVYGAESYAQRVIYLDGYIIVMGSDWGGGVQQWASWSWRFEIGHLDDLAHNHTSRGSQLGLWNKNYYSTLGALKDYNETNFNKVYFFQYTATYGYVQMNLTWNHYTNRLSEDSCANLLVLPSAPHGIRGEATDISVAYYSIGVTDGTRIYFLSAIDYGVGLTVDFIGAPTSGHGPYVSVEFTTLSSLIPGAAYLWDFGDGTTSTDRDPHHIYSEGLWTVNLTITSDAGTFYVEKVDYINIYSVELTLGTTIADWTMWFLLLLLAMFITLVVIFKRGK